MGNEELPHRLPRERTPQVLSLSLLYLVTAFRHSRRLARIAHPNEEAPHSSPSCAGRGTRRIERQRSRNVTSPNADERRPIEWSRGDPSELAIALSDPVECLRQMVEDDRPRWHAKAACRGRSDVDFFADTRLDRAAALQVCGQCRVRVECLRWAIEADDRYAVLGGTDPSARRLIRDRRRRGEG